MRERLWQNRAKGMEGRGGFQTRPYNRRYGVMLALLLGALWFAPAPRTALPDPGGVTDYGQGYYYAQTAWASLHRDGRNSDFAPLVAPFPNQVKWTALDGAAIPIAVVFGPEGHLYVTSGRGPGTSHLHALDANGNMVWEAPPQQSLDDLDSGAVFGSPTVDRDGVIYLSDSNQFWAFNADGSVKWVTEIPFATSPFVTAIITPQGYVGGVTFDGKVAFYQRQDGTLALPVLDLPGGAGPAAVPPPPGVFGGGLLDPTLIDDLYNRLFGYAFEVNNTPAISPQTGRIFIVAAGATPDVGVLYGIDIVNGELEIAFQTEMGSGSGTAPAVAADGSLVFVADGGHVMYAIDAQTGDVVWTTEGASIAASPTIGADGTVYTGGGNLSALDPADGEVLWSVNFDELAGTLLPALPPDTPFVVTGLPVGKVNGVITASARQLWVVVTLGYDVALTPNGGALPLPKLVALASVNPADGELNGYTLVRDTNESDVTIDADGSLYVSHAALLSSLFYYGLNPILPPELQLPTAPLAGITALEPVSWRALGIAGIDWVQELNVQALAQLPGGDLQAAFTATRQGRMQLAATADTIVDAAEQGEISAETATAARAEVAQAQNALTTARLILGQPNPPPFGQWLARQYMTYAAAALDEAAALLASR